MPQIVKRKSASPAARTAGCQYRLKFTVRLGVQNTSGDTTERRLAARRASIASELRATQRPSFALS
jgi:hypothetical protein